MFLSIGEHMAPIISDVFMTFKSFSDVSEDDYRFECIIITGVLFKNKYSIVLMVN